MNEAKNKEFNPMTLWQGIIMRDDTDLQRYSRKVPGRTVLEAYQAIEKDLRMNEYILPQAIWEVK